MLKSVRIVSYLFSILLLQGCSGAVNLGNDPCADITNPSYNETHASRSWYATVNILTLPHESTIISLTGKSGCVQFQLEQLTINQAIGSKSHHTTAMIFIAFY